MKVTIQNHDAVQFERLLTGLASSILKRDLMAIYCGDCEYARAIGSWILFKGEGDSVFRMLLGTEVNFHTQIARLGGRLSTQVGAGCRIIESNDFVPGVINRFKLYSAKSPHHFDSELYFGYQGTGKLEELSAEVVNFLAQTTVKLKLHLLIAINQVRELKQGSAGVLDTWLYLFNPLNGESFEMQQGDCFRNIILKECKMNAGKEVRLKIVMGEISMGLEEALTLRPGTIISLGKVEELLGCLELGGGEIARVKCRPSGDRFEVHVESLSCLTAA